jgi:hypothetical protein
MDHLTTKDLSEIISRDMPGYELSSIVEVGKALERPKVDAVAPAFSKKEQADKATRIAARVTRKTGQRGPGPRLVFINTLTKRVEGAQG